MLSLFKTLVFRPARLHWPDSNDVTDWPTLPLQWFPRVEPGPSV